MAIEQADFIRWKGDTVTKEIFKALQEAVDGLNESLMSEEVLLGEEKNRALLVGQRAGIEYLLNISIDEIIGED